MVVDLFPDPPSVGGRVVLAPASTFPSSLEQPAASAARKAAITPQPGFFEVVSSPMGGVDIAASLLLGLIIFSGPDFLLAPLGYVSGIRPGAALESLAGSLLEPEAPWLTDRRERLSSRAPPTATAAALAVCGVLGVASERLLLVMLEDGTSQHRTWCTPTPCLSLGALLTGAPRVAQARLCSRSRSAALSAAGWSR